MDRTAPHSERTEPPASPQEARPSIPMPACIAAILSVVRVLLGYGKHLDEALPELTDHSGFRAIAIGFGTHDLRRILAHVQRGILRAMMLQQYLLSRAAQGRDIEPTERPAPAEAKDIEALQIKLRPPAEPRTRTKKTNPDDPLHFCMPTLRGRILARILPDADRIRREIRTFLRSAGTSQGQFSERARQAPEHRKLRLVRSPQRDNP